MGRIGCGRQILAGSAERDRLSDGPCRQRGFSRLQLRITKKKGENEMKKTLMVLLAICLVVSLAACAASKQKKVQQEMKQPISCATAEGDIRALEHEKAHTLQRIAEGVTALVPASIVVGVVTGTEKEKLEVGTGEYNKMIDKRIAEIKETCGVK